MRSGTDARARVPIIAIRVLIIVIRALIIPGRLIAPCALPSHAAFVRAAGAAVTTLDTRADHIQQLDAGAGRSYMHRTTGRGRHANESPANRAFAGACVPLQGEPVAKKARLDLETSLASVATASKPPTGRGTPTRAAGYPRCPIKGLGDTNSLARYKPPPLNLGRPDRPPTPTEDDGVRRSARLSTSIPE